MTETILEIKNLKKSYGKNEVLKDISLSVKKGEVISIIGSSGSGKSTFLRSINLLESPSGGEILYHGDNVLEKGYDLTTYRERLGMVFQSFNLFENLNVLENAIVAQTTVLKRDRKEAESIAKANLEKVGMGEQYWKAKPKQTLPQTELAQYSHEDYAKRVEAQEKEAQEEKDKRTRAVFDYVHRTMSRFLYEEDLYKVIEAVKEWSNDTNYTPTAINRFKENVENIPLRHFVWNIAERLGKRDYTMAMRIAFIKALFPKPFEGLDYSTLKNLKAPCSNDVIPIDEPVNGRYDFR